MTQSKVAEPDIALVQAAQAGDDRALSDLIAAHLPLIYNIIGRALHGHADVDDLVQETMVRVVRGLPGLRRPDRFRSWVVAIAYRQMQLHSRRRKASFQQVQAALPDLPDPEGDFADRTVSELVLTGQRRELAEATRWLDPDDRRLLGLWWQEATGDLTRAELAEALTVPAAHAAVRVQRMRSQLDAARGVVRALRASPRCDQLGGLVRTWNGVAGPLWRKRLVRHVRDCPRCAPYREGLVPPEKLLLGVAALPVPVALAEGLRVAVTAKATGFSLLPFLQNLFGNKTVVTAAAVTVIAGGGFAYAVHTTPESPPALGLAPPAPTSSTRPIPPATTPAAAPAAPPASAAPGGTGLGVTQADFYVAPDGADTADGSAGAPFATLARAVSVVQPGQTIALRGGVHRLTAPITIDTPGTAQARITVAAYRGEQPVLDASAVTADKWAVTQTAGYWTVQGLEVRGSRSHAWVCLACTNVVFERLSMHGNARSGLTLRDPGTTGNTVLNSDFYDNYDPAEPGTAGVGLAVKFGSGDGNLLRGNRAFGNADNGIDLGEFTSPVTLEYNWSYANGVNHFGAARWEANADGFALGGGAHLLRHNAAWDNVHDGFTDNGNPAALELTNNTAFRNGATGFALSTAVAVIRSSVSIGNRVDRVLAASARSSRNSWDPDGSATPDRLRSTDPAEAQGPRPASGGLPSTAFLATTDGTGASMSGR